MYLMSSKISGLSLSRCFILSFIAVIIELALSSAPCLEDFSAAPAKHTAQAVPTLLIGAAGCAGRAPRPAVRPATTTHRTRPDQILTWQQSLHQHRCLSDLMRSSPLSGASRSRPEHGAFQQKIIPKLFSLLINLF